MSDNYWKELRNRPLPRRAVLGAGMAAGAGLLGAGLVGCGDDDTPATTGPAGTTTAASSTSASSATATPKKGGTWKIGTSTAVTGLDPYSNAIPTVALATHVFSRLFTVPSTRADSKSGAVPLDVVPDAAESMTASADLKTYTVKLRANAKWHPPISRPLDADDVVFSWKRFTGRITGTPPSPNKGLLDVIDDVSATDTKTVVFKLNKAYGPFDSLLADYALLLMPKETGTSYDPQKVMIGTGPWMFKEYTPGSSLKLVRNPEWHFGPDRPYLDGYEAYIVPDRTNQLIQFKAGQIDSYIPSGVDIADVVANVKRVQMFPRAQTNGLVGFFAFSSVTDPANKARWTDVRVRKAMSMALDRDSMMTAAYGLDSFKTAGFDLKSPWQGILPLSYGPITVQVQQEANVVPSFKYDAKAAKEIIREFKPRMTKEAYLTFQRGIAKAELFDGGKS